jgi:hypothetical protein
LRYLAFFDFRVTEQKNPEPDLQRWIWILAYEMHKHRAPDSTYRRSNQTLQFYLPEIQEKSAFHLKWLRGLNRAYSGF